MWHKQVGFRLIVPMIATLYLTYLFDCFWFNGQLSLKDDLISLSNLIINLSLLRSTQQRNQFPNAENKICSKIIGTVYSHCITNQCIGLLFWSWNLVKASLACIKFIYSEKATKFWEISTLNLSYVSLNHLLCVCFFSISTLLKLEISTLLKNVNKGS